MSSSEASKPGGNDTSSDEYVLSDIEYQQVYQLADTGQLGLLETFYSTLVEQKNAQLGPRSLCPDPTYSSPLLAAARSGHLNIVKYFIMHSEFGAEAKGKFSLNPTYSVLYRNLQVRGLTPLNAACINSKTEVMTYLLQSGADVNEPDCLGFTPLCVAVASGNIQAVDLLLNNGADANHVSCCGYSAMHLPIAANCPIYKPKQIQVIKCLLSHGAIPHMTSCASHIPCPLYLLAVAGNAELVHCITSSATCPPECIADAFLLLGIAQQRSPLGSVGKAMESSTLVFWNTAFSARNYHRLPAISTPSLLSQMYWGRTEISSMDDFNRIRSMAKFAVYEFWCQSALIVERCLKGDPLTLVYIAIEFHRYGHFDEAKRLLKRAMQVHTEMVSAQSQNTFWLNRALKTMALLLEKGALYLSYALNKAGYLSPFCWSDCVRYSLNIFAYLLDLFRSEQSRFTLHCTRVFAKVAKLLSLWLWDCESKKSESMECEELGQAFVAVYDDLRPFMSPSHPLLYICIRFSKIHLRGMLQWGADRHINDPIMHGRPIHLAERRCKIMGGSGKSLSILLSFGAHPDAVNRNGQVVDFARYGIILGIPPLSCLACQAVVAKHIDYKDLPLPAHITFLIRLHDRRAYSETEGV